MSSGPTKDEPGETSQMWHHDGEDVPPYIRVARLTPEYEYYDTTASGLTSVPGEGAEGFDLPGSSTATVERGTPDLRAAMGLSTEGDPQVTPVRILVHPADSDVRYVITMTLPVGESGEDSELVDAFVGTLSLD
nr:hypothetical protein GCM10025730_14350 [Promicromonospora thailandica]